MLSVYADNAQVECDFYAVDGDVDDDGVGDKYQLCSFSAFEVLDAPLFGRPGLVHHACLGGAGSSLFP